MDGLYGAVKMFKKLSRRMKSWCLGLGLLVTLPALDEGCVPAELQDQLDDLIGKIGDLFPIDLV